MIVLAHQDVSFDWSMGGTKSKGAHFSGGTKELTERTESKFNLEDNRRYIVKIEVRNESVKAFIDDQMIAFTTTDFRGFEPSKYYPGDRSTVGVLAWWNTLTVYRAEITECGDPGTLLRDVR